MARSIFPQISKEQAGSLVTPIIEKEVLEAINDLNNEGSPGPDGIQVFFYKEF
jgi:hypothetical protein